ncbi:four-carbon acid sugar kinase family protein [Geodermatophilus sp. YIM 151500]|uniref:four-carbon acid sugar kinase family protein n=1 Tax=Geodermatophilus sp. YIM 151500 TaxID=2984531 RepID=UPI0021E3AAAB|nr:four-carbon acid sugar kinase family protein [Geodermatophilus sp. YIM 151500]MCV2490873.1 four-carbon acid sugar kinase family protein [Geodermatophilus sp. YIM 151500]
MASVLLVADDLTGGNAAAAGFASAGLRSVTASAAERSDVIPEMVSRFDVVVANTDSRHADPDVARQLARAVVRAGWPARLVCNRIDTTLRGNVGATTEALLREVGELTGSRVVALCAPAYPAAGRHTIGGHQLLGGRRLEETEVARDARTPMRTSDVVEIVHQQAPLTARKVDMAVVTGPRVDLVAAVRTALDDGAELLVADATTEEHLDRIAEAAVAAAEGRDVVWVTVDPGPASLAMARALGLDRTAHGAPLLVVSGSATELTRRQLRRLAAERGAQPHRVPTLEGSAVPDADATTKLLDELLTAAGQGDVVVLATVVEDADVRRIEPGDADRIPRELARAVRRNLETHAVDGLFTTGGDVTAAVLAELGSHGLEISGEVVPLAVAGSVVGGPWDGLQVVTKGGLIGDAGTTVACVDHLRRTVELNRRHVASAESRTPY